jgi:hypothetical protein
VSVYTHKILTKLVSFRHLKIGRWSRAREREKLKLKSFINHHLTSIKDKIYLKQDLNRQQICRQLAETALLKLGVIGDDPAACSATKHDLDDRESIPADQGAAVVPADVTVHEEIRPETH